jgi:hypothetical protein
MFGISRSNYKWLIPAIFLSVPIMAEAEPVTYAFSGVVAPGGPSCSASDSVNGTITLDFANELPAQSTGSVGSPAGWTSVSEAATPVLLAPYVFTMTVCGVGPFLNEYLSSITVGPHGIGASFSVNDFFGGHFSFSNPSGHVSANGMPLFDSPGTGLASLGGGIPGFAFIITSVTLISPTVAKQIDSLVTESAGAPSLIDIANTAQAQVQSACISLENFVLRVKAKEAAKQLTEHRANQLVFDAKTIEIQTGC